MTHTIVFKVIGSEGKVLLEDHKVCFSPADDPKRNLEILQAAGLVIARYIEIKLFDGSTKRMAMIEQEMQELRAKARSGP